jgi:hypothetical protein
MVSLSEVGRGVPTAPIAGLVGEQAAARWGHRALPSEFVHNEFAH